MMVSALILQLVHASILNQLLIDYGNSGKREGEGKEEEEFAEKNYEKTRNLKNIKQT